jgi:hypothetical protein
MPFYAVPCQTIPYHTIPYNTIQYHTIPQDSVVLTGGGQTVVRAVRNGQHCLTLTGGQGNRQGEEGGVMVEVVRADEGKEGAGIIGGESLYNI